MNRITAGQAKVGAISISDSLSLAGTELTASVSEVNSVLDLSDVGGVRKFKKITITGASVGSTEIDSGWALPDICSVNNVYLNVITASTVAAQTCSVGLLATTSGDADGFLATVATTATGIKFGTLTATSTGYTVSNWGALLAANTTTVVGLQLARHKECVLNIDTSSKNISYTMNTTENDSLVADILVDYTEFSA